MPAEPFTLQNKMYLPTGMDGVLSPEGADVYRLCANRCLFNHISSVCWLPASVIKNRILVQAIRHLGRRIRLGRRFITGRHRLVHALKSA